MTFISVEFIIFLPVVFVLYWIFKKSNTTQNLILLISSNIFYGFWDYRFLLLLNSTIIIDYYCGKKICTTENLKIKKAYLLLSLVSCLGLLFFFKYFIFFLVSINSLLNIESLENKSFLNELILPIGISFYTFHGISYVVDIYIGKIKHEKDFIRYALFVSYFPLLVSGPIERATNLLYQLKRIKNEFSYYQATLGLRLMLFGLFKKIVIADNLSVYVDDIFLNYTLYNSSTLLLGTIFFSIQIYCDFSGYTDIAIGISKLFNINLVKNFSYPYFKASIIEFWQNWHISLSSFFKDYVYLPLGGNKEGKYLNYLKNISIVFVLSGLWHGASFNFLFWGIYHALAYLIFKFFMGLPLFRNSYFNLYDIIKYIITFIIVTFGWILFRSESLLQANSFYSKIFSKSIFELPYFQNGSSSYNLLIIVVLYFLFEYYCLIKNYDTPADFITSIKNNVIRYIAYFIILYLIVFVGNYQNNSFIYFQF